MRREIVKTLAGRLGEVLGREVVVGASTVEAPMVAVYDVGQENGYLSNGTRESKLSIQVLVVEGSYEKTIETVEKVYRFVDESPTLSGVCSSLLVESDEILLKQEDRRYYGAVVNLTAIYHQEV